MKKRFLSYWGDSDGFDFLKSSSIVFVGSLLVHILNYIFTISIGRLLGPASFGEVTALFSFLVIISVPAATITTFATYQTAQYRESKDESLIKNFISLLNTYSLFLGVIILAVFFSCLFLLSQFLHIGYVTLSIFSLIIPLTFVSAVSTGSLQGIQSFKNIQYKNILGTISKLLLAIFFVFIGLSVGGVMIAMSFSILIAVIYGFVKIKENIGKIRFFSFKKSVEITWTKIKKHLVVIFLATLFLALLSNIDVLIAKHYLSAYDAGQYSALSFLGKIIVYLVASFATVLLPVASQSHLQKSQKGRKSLWLSIFIVAVTSLIGAGIFMLLPKIIIGVFFGSQYLAVAPYLGLFGLAMSFISISIIFVNYFIAVRNRFFLFSFCASILIEIGLLAIYHHSLAEIVWVMFFSGALLMLLMFITYFFSKNYEK